MSEVLSSALKHAACYQASGFSWGEEAIIHCLGDRSEQFGVLMAITGIYGTKGGVTGVEQDVYGNNDRQGRLLGKTHSGCSMLLLHYRLL
jgi:hypothetical protein